MIPTLPIYAQSFGVSFALVSLAVSAAGFGTMFADVPVGMLMGRVGRKALMVLGTGSLAATSLLLGLAHFFPELIVYRLIAGVGTAMWNISRMAFIAETIPLADRGRALSTFGGISRTGWLVGPAIGGFIAAQFGLAAPFLFAAALDGAAFLLSLLTMPESGQRSTVGGRMRWRVMGKLFRSHYQDLATAGTAQVFAQMIRRGREIVIPLYGASVLGLDVAAVGVIISIAAAIDVSLFVPAGYLMDKHGRKFAAVPSFLILGIGMALVPFARDYYGLLVATCVMAFGNGLGSGTMMTLGADLAPKEASGEFFGLWRLIGDAGSASGPIVVGSIADVLGLSFAAFTLAGVGLIAAGTLAVFVRETLQPHQPRAPA